MTAYYLRQHLNLKPNLNECVRACLPNHYSVESDKPMVPKPPPPPPSTDKSKRTKSERGDFMEKMSDTITNLTCSLQPCGDEETVVVMAQKTC